MASDNRREQQDELVQLMLEHGEWEATDSWGNGQTTSTDAQQLLLAEKILDLLAEAWDQGLSTGRYDALYQDPEYWEDDNPYRKEDYGE